MCVSVWMVHLVCSSTAESVSGATTSCRGLLPARSSTVKEVAILEEVTTATDHQNLSNRTHTIFPVSSAIALHDIYRVYFSCTSSVRAWDCIINARLTSLRETPSLNRGHDV